jgi:hypothetical protein
MSEAFFVFFSCLNMKFRSASVNSGITKRTGNFFTKGMLGKISAAECVIH